MMIELEWVVLWCVLSFAIGVFVAEIANTRLEKAFYENLKELNEIHKKISDEND